MQQWTQKGSWNAIAVVEAKEFGLKKIEKKKQFKMKLSGCGWKNMVSTWEYGNRFLIFLGVFVRWILTINKEGT